MIVRPRPSVFDLLFTMRGPVVPLIAPRVLVIAAVSAAISLLHHFRPGTLPELPATPFTLLGLGLSIFLGFRNSACYDRWWEARRQWGQLLTETRSLAREVSALLPSDGCIQQRMTRRAIGFAHALAARLRGADSAEAARVWVPPEEAQALCRRTNPPDAILRAMTADLAECLRRGEIGEISFAALEARVAGLCGVQAACERIRTTPTPFAYTLLLHRTAWLFCLLVPFSLIGTTGAAAPLVAAILAYAFFGLDALGDELEEPFALRPNTLPLNALVRIIEIELLEGLGEARLPKPLEPVGFVLQ
jgi:ion channel-forming bestrophin family protein